VKKGRWSEAIAVGSLAFVEKIKGELGSKAMHREVEEFEGTHVLREESEVYGFKSASEKESLSPETLSSRMKASKMPGHRLVRPSYLANKKAKRVVSGEQLAKATAEKVFAWENVRRHASACPGYFFSLLLSAGAISASIFTAATPSLVIPNSLAARFERSISRPLT
jgi:hypothetical protein